MLLSELNEELSIRIGDPVDTPEAQGVTFSPQQRLKYIDRAYGKLSRSLRVLMRDYQPEFNKTRQVQTFNIHIGQSEFTIPSPIKVDEMFVKIKYKDGSTVKEGIYPSSYMEPSKYLSNKYGINDIKVNNFTDFKFKHTIMTHSTLEKVVVRMLPLATKDNYYVSAEILLVPDLFKMDWSTELPITRDYVDLLIDMAAIQAMQDIARVDKAQLFERAVDRELQILGQYGNYMKQVEGVKE